MIFFKNKTYNQSRLILSTLCILSSCLLINISLHNSKLNELVAFQKNSNVNLQSDIKDLEENTQALANHNKGLITVNQTYKIAIEKLSEQLIENSSLDTRLTLLEDTLQQGLPASKKNVESRENKVDQMTLDVLTKHALLQSVPNGSPIKNGQVSSSFGKRKHPISGLRKFHQGTDLVCRTGDPVVAPADGVIETVRPSSKGAGNLLTIRHSYGFMTSYAHLERFKGRSGQFIRKGEVIATCGNTGYSTGAHLHYEVRFAGRLLDPEVLINWSMDDFSAPFKKESKVDWVELITLVSDNIAQQSQFTESMLKDESKTSLAMHSYTQR
ncbi:M23 family metallopeptidase [Vibrio owensii]|uniref:M23 family metallopeptidase n=1 Tax=Vibrio owensii TaxID=696485 RepID=UPI003AAF0EFD